jgi:cyclic-di-GMP phosphodiesterase TipF (flagellum assembly factor)
MFAVSLAAGVAANLHAGVDLELAAACGLTLFSALLILHVVQRRRGPRKERPAGKAAPGRERHQLPETGLPLAANVEIPDPATKTGERDKWDEPMPLDPPPHADPFAPIWPNAEGAADGTTQIAEPPLHAERYGVPSSAAPLRAAPWDFRPGSHRGAPPLQSGPGAESGPEKVLMAEAAEDESAAIDRILKRLAAQIQNGTEEAARTGHAGRNPSSSASGEGVQAAALANAVESLKSAATVMRQTDEAVAAEAGTARLPYAAPASPARERLAAVADALARERVDVYLEPILGLADERARHFEVTVRLKQGTGEEFDADEVGQVGRGSGLLPLLDALRVRHSAGLALRLERRGRDGKVFSSITSESLESRQFLAGVAEGRGQGEFVTDRLVLAFEQSAVRAFAPAQWGALAGLRDQGFRFSLQGLTDLDMDFAALRTSGFEFVKLDARVFLQGLPLGQGVVPPSDLCRHMAGQGLAIIVGRIDSEAERTRIQGFGVQFGQGGLFGAPRPVNLGASGAMAGAAA